MIEVATENQRKHMNANARQVEENLNNQLENQLNNLGDQLGEGLQEAEQTWKDVQEMLTERTKDAAKAADTYVRENPWTALGVAAGIGIVAGLLMRRR
jgi:ElaB/YqjD/DUF883 family membrane-anchored ribosome-binding protein